MTKNFSLRIILSYTTNYILVDDINELVGIAQFIYNSPNINKKNFFIVKNGVHDHLLTIYPELKDIKYKVDMTTQDFVLEQEKRFGSTLPVTRIGIELPNNKVKKIGTK